MIGGGSFDKQNKVLNGAYIKTVSNRKSNRSNLVINTSSDDNSPSYIGYVWLMDLNGLLFKTSDDMYLVVKK
jgi:hypothetical protein